MNSSYQFQSVLAFLFVFFISHSSLFAQNKYGNSKIYFSFNVDTAFVQFGINKPKITKVANNDTLIVENGFYHLHLSYPTNKDVYHTVNALKDSIHEVSHQFDLDQRTIDLKSRNASIRYLVGGDLVALSDSDTEIRIGDASIGKEFAISRLKPSSQRLSFQNPKFYPKHFQVSRKESVVYKDYFFYPGNYSISFLEYIPSVSQFKRKEYIKTGFILGSIIASTSIFVKFQKKFSNKKADYLSIRKQYLNAETERQALLLGDLMEKEAEDLKPHIIRRNLSLIGVIAVLGYDFYDKLTFKKKIGMRNRKQIEVMLEPNFEYYISMGATLKL